MERRRLCESRSQAHNDLEAIAIGVSDARRYWAPSIEVASPPSGFETI
jgi:hypothetical protein